MGKGMERVFLTLCRADLQRLLVPVELIFYCLVVKVEQHGSCNAIFHKVFYSGTGQTERQLSWLQVLAGAGIPLKDTTVGSHMRMERQSGAESGKGWMISLSSSQPMSCSIPFFPSPRVPEKGSSWTLARVSPPKKYRAQPLALRNFPEK